MRPPRHEELAESEAAWRCRVAAELERDGVELSARQREVFAAARAAVSAERARQAGRGGTDGA